MGYRVRTINKIGKGKYLTSSWKIGDYLLVNCIYYIIIFPFYLVYLLFKYCFYVPIKKIIEYFSKRKPTE